MRSIYEFVKSTKFKSGRDDKVLLSTLRGTTLYTISLGEEFLYSVKQYFFFQSYSEFNNGFWLTIPENVRGHVLGEEATLNLWCREDKIYL